MNRNSAEKKRGRPKRLPTLEGFGFSAETIEQIEDLREGYCGAPAERVIAQALEHFLDNKGIEAEPEVKRRYLAARERRVTARREPAK